MGEIEAVGGAVEGMRSGEAKQKTSKWKKGKEGEAEVEAGAEKWRL